MVQIKYKQSHCNGRNQRKKIDGTNKIKKTISWYKSNKEKQFHLINQIKQIMVQTK